MHITITKIEIIKNVIICRKLQHTHTASYSERNHVSKTN